MTEQQKVRDLVTVNGVPAAEGLVVLARAVLEFDRLNRHRRRNLSKVRDAYNSMVAKASIVEPKTLDTKCHRD